MRIVGLSAELLFASRVEAALAAVGCTVAVYTGDSLDRAVSDPPDLLVLDLALPESIRADAMTAMREAGRPVIAVGSHVDEAGRQWARRAGCAEVLTRGQVARALAPLAAKHLARIG